MKIRNITETTAGATSSGSVASVAKPLGKMQERTEVSGLHTAEKVMKGKTKKKGPYRNSLSESEFNTKQQVIDYFVKRGKTAQQGAAAWERGWRGTKKSTKPTKPASDWMARWENDKQERENKLSEAELSEQDLIIVPGMRKIKDTSFIPHKLDRRDHEVEMARSEIYAAAKDAMRIFKLLKDRTEDQGIMGWQQSYITLASDYLNSVADSLDYDANVQEMTGGVLAGGMSNFEEGASEDNDTIYNNWRKDLGTDYDTTLKLVDKDHNPNKPRNVADELAKMNKKLKGVAEGIARGPKEKKLYELLSSWLHFISFKTVKIPNDAIDANGHQILASMQKHYLGPVINGMTMGEILKGDLWQNPKVIPHLLKYIYQGIPYIQERIKKFVKPSEQQNYLSAVEKIKQLYKESVAQYSQVVAEGSGKNVVKSVKVGNFRHDLVDTGFGWQVRIYNGDELYDTGMSKNSEQKGLAALEDAVAYTEKQTRTKRQGVAEADKHSFVGKLQRGHELKKKVDSSWKDIGDAQKAGDKAAGSRAFRKHERYANLERPGTWTKVDEQGVAEGMDQDEYYNIVSAISNFKDEYGEEPSGQELFDLAYSIGVEPDDVINVMYGRVVPNKGVAEGQNSSPWDQMAHLQSKSNKELDELVRFWQRSLEKNPNHKVANDQLHIIKMIRAERIGRKGVAEGWPDYDDNQYSLTDSTGKELTLLRGNTPEEAIERAKQLIGSNEKLLATFGLVKLTPRPHYIVRNAKRQGVAEGSDVEYVVVIRDEHGKRSIRVSALTPTDAKEKAEAQGYKVIKVKDPREAHYFREQSVAETLDINSDSDDAKIEQLKKLLYLDRSHKKEFGSSAGLTQKQLAAARDEIRRLSTGQIQSKSTEKVSEAKCPKCGGPSYLDQKIAEEKDACYHKVKSRYKVWPSAYASGALVRCRKVGASNWGNKSKK